MRLMATGGKTRPLTHVIPPEAISIKTIFALNAKVAQCEFAAANAYRRWNSCILEPNIASTPAAHTHTLACTLWTQPLAILDAAACTFGCG